MEEEEEEEEEEVERLRAKNEVNEVQWWRGIEEGRGGKALDLKKRRGRKRG